MALQTTGAITLANIQTEFGGANPISLSEYYAGGGLVPAGTGSIPASGAISFTNFYGASAYAYNGYWGGVITYPSNTRIFCMYVNANGIYIGDGIGRIIRISPQDDISLQGHIVSSILTTNPNYTNLARIGGITSDSSGNIFVLGNFRDTSTNNNIFVSKLNSSGVPQWTYREYGNTGVAVAVDENIKIGINSSGQIIVFPQGRRQSADSNYSVYSLILSPTGTRVNRRSSYGSIFNSFGSYYRGIIDSIGRIYTIASPYSNGAYVGVLSAFDSTNTSTRWIRSYTMSGWDSLIRDLAVDPSDNICLLFGLTTSGNARPVVIQKIDSSATVLWVKKYVAGYGDQALSITTDSSGNIYAAFQNQYYASRFATVIKLNSSGVEQWIRTLTYSGKLCYINTMTVYNDKLYMGGSVTDVSGTPSNSAIVVLPTDGSRTGTKGNWTWATASSWADGTLGVTEVTTGGSTPNMLISDSQTGNIAVTFSPTSDTQTKTAL